jgi:hypothetical protein
MSDVDFSNAAYTAHINDHKLMGARCQTCGAIHLPPRAICSQCHSEAIEWAELSSKGKLLAYTVIHIAPSAMIAAGYGRDNPYCTGIVQIEQGPAISAQILGVDVARPEAIAIGASVEATFIERGEGEQKQTFLAFRAHA